MAMIRTIRTFPTVWLALLIPAAAAPAHSAGGGQAGIDAVAVYSTYLGGSAEDEIAAVAVDAAGNTYVTGDTDSIDFPVAGTIQPLRTRDAFVSKLDPNGELVWSTLLGGEEFDAGFGIAVDAGGHVAVAGGTHSADFPRIGTSLPLPPPQGLISDLFVARLDPSGSSLLWSARIGGSDLEEASGLAADPAGHLYVVGSTLSRDFPVHAALQPSVADAYNTFLMKLTPDGDFVYSTYLGGGNLDDAMDVAADSAGSAYVAGATNSSDFPTRNAAQPALGGGGGDAFILRVAPDGSALVWSTYLGGSSGDFGLGIALGRDGSVHATGVTGSSDFPVRNALQPGISSPAPYADAFVARLDPAGSLVASTYLGGSEVDWGNDVAVDAQGSAWVMGFTESTDFPVREPFQAECRPAGGTYCSPDLFLAQLTPAGDALVQASYLGGTANEENAYIAIDPRGFASIAGWTTSADFPTVRAFQPSPPGGMLNGFVLRMAPPNRPPDCSASFASPATLWPPNGRLVPVSILGVTVPDGDPVTLRVTAIRQDEPLTKAGAPDAAGLGTARSSVRAGRTGNGDGRVYHLTFEATGLAGAACTGTVAVCVPHDPGKAACGDGGALVDSTGATR